MKINITGQGKYYGSNIVYNTTPRKALIIYNYLIDKYQNQARVELIWLNIIWN